MWQQLEKLEEELEEAKKADGEANVTESGSHKFQQVPPGGVRRRHLCRGTGVLAQASQAGSASRNTGTRPFSLQGLW
jgi:hypothetical protein